MVWGAPVSTVKPCWAGVASTLSAASVARTANVWGPSESAAVVCSEVQPVKAAPSTLHSNVEPASSEEKPNVGVESAVGPVGPESIVVSGGSVSPFPSATEKAVRKERVSDLPAGRSKSQLMPMPLSNGSDSMQQKFGYPSPGGLNTCSRSPANHWAPSLTGTKPSTRPGGALFLFTEQKMPPDASSW